MKVAVFGATGRTGRLLVERALGAGHEVVAFARDGSKLGLESGRLSVVEGDVRDGERVGAAVSGADAVLVALGHTKGSPEDVQTEGTRRIVAAMRESGVRRIVSLTGAGVRDEEDQPKVVDRAFVALLGRLQPAVLEDARRHAEVIRESGLDWTVVRAPRLTDGPHTGDYRTGYVGRGSGTKVSRADVADFMLRQLEDETYLGRMPMVSY